MLGILFIIGYIAVIPFAMRWAAYCLYADACDIYGRKTDVGMDGFDAFFAIFFSFIWPLMMPIVTLMSSESRRRLKGKPKKKNILIRLLFDRFDKS